MLMSLLIFSLAYRKIRLEQFAISDISAWPSIPSLLMPSEFGSAWYFQNLGQAYAAPPSLLVYQAIGSLFAGNEGLAQPLFYLSLLPISFVTMYALLYNIVKPNGARFAGAFLYAINPWSVSQMAGGAGYLTLYPIPPLMLLLLLQMVREPDKRVRNAIMLSAVGAFGSWFNSYFPVVVAPLLIVPSILVSTRVSWREVRSATSLILLMSILWFVLALPIYFYVLQSIISYGASYAALSYGHVSSLNSLYGDVTSTYSGASMINLLRMTWGPVWYGGSIQWLIVSFSIPAIAFATVASQRSRREPFLALCILSLSIISFVWLTHLGVLESLFYAFPVLFVFRNPIPAIMLLPLCFAVLLSSSLESIAIRLSHLRRFRNIHKIVSQAVLLLFIIGLLFYNWPVIATGDMGLSLASNSQYVTPNVYYELRNWFATQDASHPYRVLVLPYSHNVEIRSPVIGVRTIGPPPNLTDVLTSNKTNQLGALLGTLNVKFIIVLASEGSPGEISSIIQVLKNQSALTLVANATDFQIFQNLQFVPYLSAFTRYFELASTGTSQNQTEYVDSPNLLTNPDFVNGTQGWTGSNISVVNDTPTTGDYSLQIRNTSKALIWSFASQEVRVGPGLEYRASIFAMVQNARASHLRVLWFSEPNPPSEDAAIRKDFLQVGNPSSGWHEVSIDLLGPPGAFFVMFQVLGGPPLDNSTQGLTWFTHARLVEILRLIPSPQSNFSLLSRLAYMPNFSMQNQLITFWNAQLGVGNSGEGPSLFAVDDELPWENAASSNSFPTAYSFEAASAFIPTSGHWDLATDNNASNGSVLSGKQGSIHRDFFALTNAFYFISIRHSVSLNVSFAIDHTVVPRVLVQSQGEFAWTFSESVFLQRGHHDLEISIDSAIGGLLDIVNVLSSKDGMAYANIIEPSSLSPLLSVRQISPTQFLVQITSDSPTYIALGESYDYHWTAALKAQELAHFVGEGWANAYYLPGIGTNSIVVNFVGQQSRMIAIYIWVLSWAGVMVAMVRFHIYRKGR
jgi:hypothetical protein